MKYLTAEQVLFIHARLIAETGGAHGVRDLGLLLSAIARPQATFDGQDLYPDIFSKAGAMLESLIGNHIVDRCLLQHLCVRVIKYPEHPFAHETR